MTNDPARAGLWENREAFWTLAVGVPAAFSVLRIWVESGGDLQITLLLVSHVGPFDLGASLFATTAGITTMVLIALFTAGGILRASCLHAAEESHLRKFPPLAARMTTAAPAWFVIMTFALAAI